MYKEHPSFDLDPGDRSLRIWRYLTFTKFVAMLRDSSLYFSAPERLGDSFEGSLTRLDADDHRNEVTRSFSLFAGPVGLELDGLYDDQNSWVEYNRARIDFEHMRQDMNPSVPPSALVLVSCWHLGEHESAAMWNVYVGSSEGVAIQSRVGRLIGSFSASPDVAIHLGKVKYIDYSTQRSGAKNLFERLLTKRSSFSDEHELRAICYPDWDPVTHKPRIEPRSAPPGQNINVDLHELIERVFVAPGAAGWFSKLVEGVIGDYRLSRDLVTSSSQDDRPLF